MSIDATSAILEELKGHVQTGNIVAGKQCLAQMKVRNTIYIFSIISHLHNIFKYSYMIHHS